MLKLVFIFITGLICFNSLLAQDYTYDLKGNRIGWGTQDFDSLYKHLDSTKNFKDSIKYYEDKIYYTTFFIIAQLHTTDTLNKQNPRTLIYCTLKDYQQNFKTSLKSLSDLFYLSYAKNNGEHKVASELFYLKELKESYYYLIAIRENIETNFDDLW
jgi:hypothetical protein